MSLRWRLLCYLFIVHACFLALTFYFFLSQPLTLVCIELGLSLSLGLGIYLVSKVLQPLDFSRQFHDLLQDGLYASRLKSGGNSEINALAALFNRMLETLYQERLQLGEQRGFLDRLLEATPTAVLVFDFDGKISLMNASAQQLLGVKSPEACSLQQLADDDGLREQALINQLDALTIGDSMVFADKDGRRYRCQRNQFLDRGFQRDFILVDEISAELASSEKATYEKLIRVLAHEVNNTVAATGSVLESLLFYSGQLRSEDCQDFSTAIAAVKKRNGNLGEFIDRFTRVVKMPEPELKPHDLLAMLDGIIYLYRQQCSESGISLSLNCSPLTELPLLMLDAHLMEQALLNIVKNAVEALSASNRKGQEVPAYIQIDLKHDASQRVIYLSVIDSARLLAEIPQAQLFTPFFTTKKGGQGIGLMFVREVLHRHAYHHRLTTNAQGDTSFDIVINY